jgi:hypothetical protein
MNTTVIPSYTFTVLLPDISVHDITCDNTMSCDSNWTVDYLFIPNTFREAIMPLFLFTYILPELTYLSCDNTYLTSDNLITIDNG